MSDKLVEGAALDEILNTITSSNIARLSLTMSVPREYKGLELESYIALSVRSCDIRLRIVDEGAQETILVHKLTR